MTARQCARAVSAAAVMVFPLAHSARAQSLRGSRASINRMYHHARAERLPFYETSRGVLRAVSAGRLVPLVPDDNFTLHEVSYPFVKPVTRTFVERLGAQYRAACGQVLEVTSAVRPATRQPPNSTARSVHPTGMAVDLHKSAHAPCVRWLRETLLELEGAGLIEVTEEFAPPHFHVAVYQTPYRQYVAARRRSEEAVRLASSGASDVVRYQVRRGDTLSEIAESHNTTVDAITTANDLDDTIIQPGQKLLIPSGG